MSTTETITQIVREPQTVTAIASVAAEKPLTNADTSENDELPEAEPAIEPMQFHCHTAVRFKDPARSGTFEVRGTRRIRDIGDFLLIGEEWLSADLYENVEAEAAA
jgi:hypothetical protein